MINFNEIKAVANHDLNYLMKLLPNAVKRGNELVCGNIYGDKGESFSYNISSGLWSDFAHGETGASVLDLVMARENCSVKEAAEIISAEFGGLKETSTKPVVVKEKPSKVVISERAEKGSQPSGAYIDGVWHTFSARWCYHDEEGYPIAYDCRIDTDDGKKIVLPFLYNGEKWYQKMLPEKRKLYNLHHITEYPERTIIISEGCKTANAVAKYFPNYVCTTWQGGSNSTGRTDWSPLSHRKIIIIPDADDCGRKAAEKIANLLKKSCASVRIVDTSSMEQIKKGWDMADALAAGMPQDEVVRFIKTNLHDYIATEVDGDNVIDPEVIVRSKPTIDYDDTFFRCLGVQGDVHFFYKKKTSQIIEFKPSSYDSKHLINLAPMSWWQVNYPDKSGVNWLQATDELCRVQEIIGVFDRAKIRGRGAWFDSGRTVLHLGEFLFTNGQIIDIDDFESEYFYERSPSLAVKVQTVLPAQDSRKLIELCRMARWDNPSYGDILAGWMFSALVCGAMPFRSHIYLIGAAGTGKSWMLDNVVKRIMGNIALSVSSKSTEAGIRDQLGGDIRPVIFDEAEAENQNDKTRMQSVFDLARNGSSEKADAIVKFGAKYVCRSAFLFASINSSMSKTADLSRTSFIKLANAPVRKSAELKQADNDKFRKLEIFASHLLTDEYIRCLLSRAIALVPVLRASHKVIADVAARDFGSRRLGDQMAMIISGLWGLQSDEVIEESVARKLIEQTCIKSDKDDDDNKTQEENALDHLLFSTIETQTRTGNKKYLLSLLISYLQGCESIDGLEREQVAVDLASKGIAIKKVGNLDCLMLSTNKATLPARLFKDSEWEFGWAEALLRIEDINKSTNNVYFSRTLTSKAIAVPLHLIIKDPLLA